MKVLIWNAFSQFHCIAQDCSDSCCAQWEVDLDEDTAGRYRLLPGALGDRLRQVMQTAGGQTSMILENGRCPMWRQDGLCRIQAELDHDALCKVCREFPRLYQDYGDFQEWGLELSCPEAARLIFEDPGAMPSEISQQGCGEYDRELMDILLRSREEILRFWENTQLSLPEALAVTLLYGYQVQGAVDGGEYVTLDPAACLKTAKEFAGRGDEKALLAFFGRLEILTQAWKNRLQAPQKGSWDHKLKALASYIIRRYWLQAVWDYDLTSRVKLGVIGCILVNLLGGDPVETAQQFSKEIENDPDNIEAILDGAYTAPALTDANLLGLLLNP